MSEQGGGVPRIKDLLHQALDLEGAEREALLAGLAAEEPAVHARLLQLLEAHSSSAALDSMTLPHVRARRERPTSLVQVGERIGQYEVLEMIGSGGAGIVYRARQLGIGRVVALKVLRAGRFATEEEVRRFRAEAEVVARLDHPGIVPLYEVGEEDGRHYFSMKLIEGENLAARAVELREDPRAAVALLAKVARAVQHGHARGILHRDLKPSNVLLDAQGAPYVADFGVAKRTDGEQVHTRSGVLAGTPAYMAPEQFTGKGADATVAIDVYGLGCILFELLAGRPVFSGASTGEIMQKVWSEPARFTPEEQARIPRDLRTICLRCLDKPPDRRYPSAAALADDLENWLAGRPIQARHVGPVERLLLQWKRKPLQTSLAAGVVLLATALVVGTAAVSVVLNSSLKRAVLAEGDAQDLLRASRVATARATRRTDQVGRRFESLELLRQAAAIAPGADLRDEAVACMAQSDLRVDWMQSLPGERGRVLAVDADLERIAVGLADRTVRVSRLVDGLPEVCRIQTGEVRPWHIEFSPDGRLLAIKAHGTWEGSEPRLLVWDLEEDRALHDLPMPVAGHALTFSSDSSRLLLGRPDGEVLLLDLADGSVAARYAMEGAPTDASFAPLGGLLAVLDGGGAVEVLAADDLAPRQRILCPGTPYAVDWAPDGRSLLVGSTDGRAYVFALGQDEPVRVLEGHKAEVVAARFLRGGRLAVTHAWDGTMRLSEVDSAEGQVWATWAMLGARASDGRVAFVTNDQVGLATAFHEDVLRILRGHTLKGPSGVAFSPDGRLLATCAPDGLLVWVLASGRRTEVYAEFVNGVAFHPRTGALYAGTREGILMWADPRSGAAPVEIVAGNAEDLEFTRDGATLTYRTGNRICRLAADTGDVQEPRVLVVSSGTTRPTSSSDGRWLAAGAWRGRGVPVWDARSQAEVTLLQEEDSSVAVAFSPDSRFLATGSASAYRLWRTGDWEMVWEVPRDRFFGDLPGSLAFSADSRLLAVTPDRQRMQVVEVATGAVLLTLEAPELDPLTMLAFSPDGKLLVAGTSAQRVQIWSLAAIRSKLAELGLATGED